MEGEGFLENCLQGQAMYRGPGKEWIWPWKRSWHFPSRMSAITSPVLLACGHWAGPSRTMGPESPGAWSLSSLGPVNPKPPESEVFSDCDLHMGGGLGAPKQPRANYSAMLGGQKASENTQRKAFCFSTISLAHQPQSDSAITNQPLNRRSLTVRCKSLRLVKICAKLIPKEQSNLRST